MDGEKERREAFGAGGADGATLRRGGGGRALLRQRRSPENVGRSCSKVCARRDWFDLMQISSPTQRMRLIRRDLTCASPPLQVATLRV